jgi:hypothetical protein
LRYLYRSARRLLTKQASATWSVSWFWFIGQMVFGCCLVFLSYRVPAPGIAIGILGLLAVVATFESGPSRLQRSIWILISTGFLLVELDAIHMDRVQSQGEQDYARAVDRTRFSQTYAALRTSIRNEETQRKTDGDRFRSTIARLQDSIKTQTGGDSYCYLSFEGNYGGQSFSVSMVKKGRYPVRGVNVMILDTVKSQAFDEAHFGHPTPNPDAMAQRLAMDQESGVTRIPIDDLAYDKRRLFDYPIIRADYDYQQYIIDISPINNDWTEEILMKKRPGPYLGSPTPASWHWSRALILNGPGNKEIWSDIDADYPKDPQNRPLHFGVSPGPPQK